jgi:hypothetical protein
LIGAPPPANAAYDTNRRRRWKSPTLPPVDLMPLAALLRQTNQQRSCDLHRTIKEIILELRRILAYYLDE